MAARALEGNKMAKFARADIRKIIGEACTDEMETALIALHHSIVDEVKDQLDAAKADAEKYKTEADKLPGIQQELDALKSGEDYKAKYDKEHQDFENYKKQIADGEELSKKKAAFRQLLVDEHISEKRLDAVIRLTDFTGIKLDKDGKLQDVDGLKKTIGEEWGEYKVTTQKRGAQVATPPSGGNAGDNGGKPQSRAAELAAQYRESKYGVRSESK